MNVKDFPWEMKKIIELVETITGIGGMRSNSDKKEKWATFKKENEPLIRNLLNITDELTDNPCNVISFDIDEERQLLLLNYTSQAHNVLHVYDNGWSNELKLCRGLVFSFKEEVKLVSRGFEKFFNANEQRENQTNSLINKYKGKFNAYEKIDGHMIEFFENENELCATTRGKFNTLSAQESLSLVSPKEWKACKSFLKTAHNIDLMTIVAELVSPSSKVFVDYDNKENVYILAAYDKLGNKIDNGLLKNISSFIDKAKLPKFKQFTVKEMFEEVRRRDVDNNEGWVMDLDGTLLKFKYNNYIGMMVNSKMSYRYLMQTIMNKTTDRMISTLDRESLSNANMLLSNIKLKELECSNLNSYKPLYELWSDEEGSLNYFRLVCRKFYKEYLVSSL
jgi:hypothetical protein